MKHHAPLTIAAALAVKIYKPDLGYANEPMAFPGIVGHGGSFKPGPLRR